MKVVVRVLALLVVGVVAGGVVFMVFGSQLGSLFGTATKSSSSQVIKAVDREEQVVLVSLGIQGLEREEATQQVLGKNILGGGRVKYVEYSFKAKLGIEGKDVQITEQGEDSYLITIPEFIFIGHDEIEFQEPIEKNGVLSWVTPTIQDHAITNRILSSEKGAEYINEYRDLLEDQTKFFYETLIRSVNPEAEIEFLFLGKGV